MAIEDIAERKRAEDVLREQTAMLESILQNIGEGVVVADLQGKFLYFNQAAERILGTHRLDIPQEEWSEGFGLFLPDQVTPFPPQELPLARAMRGEGVTDIEYFVRRPNQEGIFCAATGSPLRDAQGNLRGGIVVFRDISHRRKTEKALVRAKNEAERANSFKDQFLSTMSHELRTPLNAILGFSELMSDERYGALNDRQQRYVGNIRAGGKHLLRLINDILDLSRIEAGHLELTRESIAVNAAVSEVLGALQPLADNKSQHLVQDVRKDIAVWADATRFQQVLTNLIGNAIKFTPDGGLIQISARLFDELVRIEIRDSGPGIPPEEQKRIFEAFYRLRQFGQAPEGTGSGLAITQRLVELQGGVLGLESEPGKGSCFFFQLPAGSRVPAEMQNESPVVVTTKQLRVLVIDDEPTAAQLIRSHLAAAGYEVDVCDQPERAMELAAQLRPDAITLDLLMKPVHGWEILLQLKNNPSTALIPVLVVSVVDQPGVGATLGADAYLVKPVEKEDLLAAIRRCLGGKGGPPLKRSVLVVEDDTVTLEIICELLRGQGYSVVTARDGAEARKAVQESLPELVILDLLLPKASGLELLAEWRANPRTADVPVFVLSNKDLTSEEEKYLRSQAEALLRKKQPWKEDLLNQVRKVLGSLQPAIV